MPCESTAKKVSFEWSHQRISSTGSKVRITLDVPITDSGSGRVNACPLFLDQESFCSQLAPHQASEGTKYLPDSKNLL